jgi:hypothetical protein
MFIRLVSSKTELTWSETTPTFVCVGPIGDEEYSALIGNVVVDDGGVGEITCDGLDACGDVQATTEIVVNKTTISK